MLEEARENKAMSMEERDQRMLATIGWQADEVRDWWLSPAEPGQKRMRLEDSFKYDQAEAVPGEC